MTTTSQVPALPIDRTDPFDPPVELMRWQREAPMRRLRYPDGHVGWLVTGYAEARAVLADPRFSVRPELAHSPTSTTTGLSVPPGFFLRMDPPRHARYRRLLTGAFTVHRMRALVPRIATIVDEQLDAVAALGGAADLVTTFALPVPSLLICELLEIPYDDRARFQRDAATILTTDAAPRARADAFTDLTTYLTGWAETALRQPSDGMLGGLAAEDLSTEELTGMAMLLLIAGHETTANMLGLGTFAGLQDAGQRAALVGADEWAAALAVEELLRHLSVITIVVRAALADVEVAGHTVRAGETVTVSLAAANRDPGQFPDGDRLDLARGAHGQLAFGHGIHQCLGQQLARLEMRAALPALFRRFPGLRLAVPPEEVPMRSNMAVYGVHHLPVEW